MPEDGDEVGDKVATIDVQTLLEAFLQHVPKIYLFQWWSFFSGKKQKFQS